MKIESMREYITLCEYLNFTSAAKKLYTTQPSLSYRIAGIEKEIGVQLVDRGGSALALTPAGKVFLGEAQKLVKDYDTALEKCRRASRKRDELVMERPVGFPKAAQQLDSLVSSFVRSGSSVGVRFTCSDGKLLRDVLLDGVADCGVVYAPCDFSDDPELAERVEIRQIQRSFDVELYAWIHDNHPLASKDPLRAGDLDGSLLAIQSDARYRIGWNCFENLFSQYGVTFDFHGKPAKDAIDFLWEVEDDEIVITDVGWCDMYSSSFEPFQNRSLRLIEGQNLSIDAFLVFLRDNANPALRAFLEFADR